MEFIETSFFTRRINTVLTEDGYRALQSALIEKPGAGVKIPGAGGLRKLRWQVEGKGKRGGLRVIYYWLTNAGKILFLHAFTKSEAEDLTPDTIAGLRRLVKEWIR